MKRGILLLILLILLMPTILAVNIDLSKSSYNPQETLQTEITGNFISFTHDNVLIYKQDAVHSTPIISDLTKQGNIYYFYAIVPNQEGNFTLKIENSEYIEAGQTKTDTVSQDFTIKKTNESALKINPGFIKSSDDFSIKVTALNNNQDLTATFSDQSQTVSLIKDTEKTFFFFVSGQEPATSNLKISDYDIPVFIIGKTQDEEDEIIQNQTNQSQTTNETEPKVSIENKTEGEIKGLECSEIENGKQCQDNEKCDKNPVESLDGPCCVGECKEEKQSNVGLWIGIILIVFVVLALLYLYLKSKKYLKPKSTEDFLKDKAKKFSERMKGKEVTGNVTKS